MQMKCVCCAVICHVVGITYQTIERRLLAEMLGDPLGKLVLGIYECPNL